LYYVLLKVFSCYITCTYIIKCYVCKIQYSVSQSCALLTLNLKWKRGDCKFLVCHNLLITVFCFYKWVRNNWTSQPAASIGCWKEVKKANASLQTLIWFQALPKQTYLFLWHNLYTIWNCIVLYPTYYILHLKYCVTVWRL